jgi:hypothetical protein
MALLRVLTLIWVAVLVLALAVSLTAIWIYLRRIGRSLGAVKGSLIDVEERTRPMKDHLAALKQEMEQACEPFCDAEQRVRRVSERTPEPAAPAVGGEQG